MEEEKEMELSMDKKYHLPDFNMVYYKNYVLAIDVNKAKWIVLENDEQYKVFEMLCNNFSIGEVLEKYAFNQEAVISVLTQIEAKQMGAVERKSIFKNTRLHLHLTNKCNLHCPHCYMKSGMTYDDELTTKEIIKLCDDFQQYGGTNVSITGGEPMMRSDFFSIVEHIAELGMEVSIFSNGLLWNEEMIKRLQPLNVEGVQISIDGYDEKSNSIVRGKGAFRKALNAVDLLVKHNIYVKIAVTAPYEVICKHQKEYINFSKEIIKEYGGDAVEFNYSYFLMPGRDLDINKIEKWKDEYYRLVDEVIFGIYGDLSEETFISNILDCIYDSCGYGGLNVMANGDFYFCDRITDASKIGNIRNLPFEKIFRLIKIAEKAGKIDNFMPCKNCELKYICGGGCRAEYFRNFTQNMDITSIDFDSIPPRKCNKEYKEKFYELMIKTNERFYR